jgi:RNA polymerase sigma-70 factor (ECF subfamily)
LEKLCKSYWPPLYTYIRRQGHPPEDAQDITQAFFASLLQRNDLGGVHPERGKFRSFLLASVNNFLSHERERAQAAKRGGGQSLLSLDGIDTEEISAVDSAAHSSPEAAFERRWAIMVLERAFARVRKEFAVAGKERVFERLKPYLEEEAEAGEYQAAAADLGLSSNAVAVAVHRLRHRFRKAVREEIADTVAGPQELEEEMRHLFSILRH